MGLCPERRVGNDFTHLAHSGAPGADLKTPRSTGSSASPEFTDATAQTGIQKGFKMAGKDSYSDEGRKVTREELISLLNDDLAREYQAVIAYVVYSQVLKGAQYMNIAAELKKHAAEELDHALTIAGQIDYLGGMPVVAPKAVKTSAKPEEMLRFDLDNETETIRQYRERVCQCEGLGEFAMAEHIREILMDEQDHQISLATALGIEVPRKSLPDRD
jgi:bacterioferritin